MVAHPAIDLIARFAQRVHCGFNSSRGIKYCRSLPGTPETVEVGGDLFRPAVTGGGKVKLQPLPRLPDRAMALVLSRPPGHLNDAKSRFLPNKALFRAHPEYAAPTAMLAAIRAVLTQEGFLQRELPQ